LYESAIELVNHIQANAEQDTPQTDNDPNIDLEKVMYYIDTSVNLLANPSTKDYCTDFVVKSNAKNIGNINIYPLDDVRAPDAGIAPDEEIVQFLDYSTFYDHYVDSYVFQFAVKNINIENSCFGP
jgi:hypothetical protein